MRRITIDNTNLSVSRISFGTGSLHHWLRLLDAAFSAGVTHFDTSPYYGFGVAESDLGEFLHGKRDRVTVATKIGLYSPGASTPSILSVWRRKLAGKFYPQIAEPRIDWTLEAAEKSLAASLKRCRTDYVDILFFHEPIQHMICVDAFVDWLGTQRAAGKIRHWGIAGSGPCVKHWSSTEHPLSTIIQTKDSLDGGEADFVRNAGRKLQFTYGYMNGPESARPENRTIRQALDRNPDGSVVMSTRRLERVYQLADIDG